MEFQTPAVQACYERISPLVKEIFGEFAQANPEYPSFGIEIGSAWITIALYAWGQDDVSIRTAAYVVSGAELTTDLMHYLLKENASTRFGAFGIDAEGDIILHHSIGGASCDKSDLRASAMSIVTAADRVDDEIIARFGGQRAIDKQPA